jgi:lysophospholipase L1-like esterase
MASLTHRALLALTLLLSAALQPVSAQVDPWQAELNRFIADDQATTPPNAPIVFVGSSSIRLWPNLDHVFSNPGILNRGFGGSQLADAERLADLLVLRYRPRQVVIYAGDNDLAEGLLPAQVAADFVSLVRRLRSTRPKLAIAFIAIKPSPARAHLMAAARDANMRIRRFAESEDGIAYIDVFTPMLDRYGNARSELFGPDGLHLNTAGYALWAEQVAPFLR